MGKITLEYEKRQIRSFYSNLSNIKWNLFEEQKEKRSNLDKHYNTWKDTIQLFDNFPTIAPGPIITLFKMGVGGPKRPPLSVFPV